MRNYKEVSIMKKWTIALALLLVIGWTSIGLPALHSVAFAASTAITYDEYLNKAAEYQNYEASIKQKISAIKNEGDLYYGSSTHFAQDVSALTTQISTVKRKLSSLNGDNSSSARAQKAKLNAELSALEAELDELYAAKSRTSQIEGLENELQAFYEHLFGECTGSSYKHAMRWVTVIAASCDKAGMDHYACSRCSYYAVSSVAATGHTEVIDAAVAPTCAKSGLSKGKHCSACGAVLLAQKYVSPLPHNKVIDKAVSPTCTESGLTQGSHCADCKKVIVAQQVIPPRHTIATDPAIAPTLTETGLTKGTHCSKCGIILTPQEIVPAIPTIGIKVAGPSALCIQWTSVNCDGYVLKRSTTPNGTYSIVATLDNDVLTYTDTNLKKGKAYYYTITAYNNGGQDSILSLASKNVTAKPALIKVTGIKGQSIGYNAAKITWDCQPGADAYRVYMRTGKKAAAAKLVATVKNPNGRVTLSRVVKKLDCGTTYYLEVRAYHGGKEGPASKKIAVKPVPAAVKNLKSVAKAGRKVVLSWTKVSGTTGYEIYRSSKEASGYKKIDEVTANMVALKSQTANRTFYYKIRAYRTVNGKKVYGPYCDPISCRVKK